MSEQKKANISQVLGIWPPSNTWQVLKVIPTKFPRNGTFQRPMVSFRNSPSLWRSLHQLLSAIKVKCRSLSRNHGETKPHFHIWWENHVETSRHGDEPPSFIGKHGNIEECGRTCSQASEWSGRHQGLPSVLSISLGMAAFWFSSLETLQYQFHHQSINININWCVD